MLWSNKSNLAGFAAKCNGKNEVVHCSVCKRFSQNHYTSYYVDLRGDCVNFVRVAKTG